MLTQERLKELLNYDPYTGVFTWKVRRNQFVGVGSVANHKHEGYIRIRIDVARHFAHRLAWLYMTGQWPKDQIDHRDLNRANNRFDNLREATNSKNKMNIAIPSTNTSGLKGVSWSKAEKKWYAHIGVNRKRIFLGFYATKEAASLAYEEAAMKYHGEFARIK